MKLKQWYNKLKCENRGLYGKNIRCKTTITKITINVSKNRENR